MNARTGAVAITIGTLFYVGLLGWYGIVLVSAGGVGPVGLGVGVLMMVPLGLWVVGSTVRSGMRHAHLARRLADEGALPDTTELARRPSGRVEREAADAFFAERQAEWEVAPDDWRTTFRLAVAYDTAGDRTRARETMKRAVALEAEEARP